MTRILLILLLVSSFAFSQDDGGTKKDKKGGGVFKDAGDAAKMIVAKQKLYAGQYVSALNTYREIEKNEPGNGTVLYYIAYCHYGLKDIPKAKEYLLKAKDSKENYKNETNLLLGKIYQAEEEYDKAIEEFTAYKNNTSKDKENGDEADVLLSQCQNAKKMIATPLAVEVTNLGPDVNSKYDDKNPCITADGSKLVFTTRRPESTNSELDAEGDGKYFEDIFISNYDSAGKKFGKADEVPGSINTKAHDACTSISADGKQIFLYKNDINDKESRGGDVFVSKVNSGKWKTPEPIGKPIASSYWEGGACISPDGKKYFFTSERPGGFGGSDIWMVERINKKEWGKPVNLGSDVNTKFDEAGMFLAPDGKTLFFCSNGPNTMGSYDVFKTVNNGGKWSTPVNLGYPINSSAKEGQLTISADARYAYISSERKGGLGENDIYKVDLKDYAILEADGKKKVSSGLSILKGTIRDGYEGYGLPDAEIVITDGSGAQVASTNSNENGEYFITMKGGNYTLSVKKKGFKDITESINLKTSDKETVTLEKGYLLKK
ncbi:MAG: PD40 domain-containing protein [Bacteroidetes bacterium]|nr:PD40 domain-containing protein [Bacteroidota bacterium]